jgi:hypothetical protein
MIEDLDLVGVLWFSLDIQPSAGANMASKKAIVTTLLASLLFSLLIVAGSAQAEDSDANNTDSEMNDEADRPGDQEWRYDTYYIFPLTRHMPDSELPMAGQIALYPFAFVIDCVQWPFGLLVGLGGE